MFLTFSVQLLQAVMKLHFHFLLLLFLSAACSNTEGNKNTLKENSTVTEKPKLVVGIVVDQMRYDYLNRFFNKYGDGGFHI